MATNSFQRTKAWLVEQGFETWKTETFNMYSGHREDMFGFVDILGIHPDHGTVGVQACGQDWAPHVEKLTVEKKDIVTRWLLARGSVWLVGWRKLKAVTKDGKKGKAERWAPRLGQVCLSAADGLIVVESTERGYICAVCAAELGGSWPKGHGATCHSGMCPECWKVKSLASVGDYDWPQGSRRPRHSGGRD